MTQIAVCGLGVMGNGMARTLIKAGHTVTVYNRTRSRAEPFAALGAQIAETPFAAAQNADVIICIVADDHASRTVWLGEQAALKGARPGTLLIESSTLTPGWIRQLDAPVTGSKAQAENGELGFLVGGKAETLERARPLLMQMGKTIHYLGANGSGAMMKLINNMVAGVQLQALAEGLTLAEQSGLDMNQVAQMLMEGPPGSPLVKRKMPQLLAHEYEPRFSLRLMHKDFSYGLNEAAQRDVSMPTIAVAREMMRLAMARGWGDKDNAVIYELLRPNA
jgi:3-hydroxyisobutyrate dehydrogenase